MDWYYTLLNKDFLLQTPSNKELHVLRKCNSNCRNHQRKSIWKATKYLRQRPAPSQICPTSGESTCDTTLSKPWPEAASNYFSLWVSSSRTILTVKTIRLETLTINSKLCSSTSSQCIYNQGGSTDKLVLGKDKDISDELTRA